MNSFKLNWITKIFTCERVGSNKCKIIKEKEKNKIKTKKTEIFI